MKKISLCIPTWERFEMVFEVFKYVYDDERIGEIVIVDDCSSMVIFEKLSILCKEFDKIKLFRNVTNQGCYKNKYISVSFATNKYCILIDSDNSIGVDYLNRIYENEWDAKTILTPEFAKPHFDFRAYSGLEITAQNVSQYIEKPMFEVMLNACNYFVNVKEYCHNFDPTIEPMTSDSIFTCYNWLKNGGAIYVVPGLQYSHRVHPQSHYQNFVNKTPAGFHQGILNQLKEMA